MCSLRSFLSIIFCLLCITGCISTPRPEAWPEEKTTTAPQCPDLTGTYLNDGLDSDGDPILLARIFFSGMHDSSTEYWEMYAVSHLTFENQGEDALVVKTWVGSELWMERKIIATQLPCRKGRLVYRSSSWDIGGVYPGLPVIVHGSVDHLMTVAADGSLVMENKEFDKGIFALIPIAISAQYWFRFPPLSSTDSSGRLGNGANPGGVRSDAPPVYRLLPPEGATERFGSHVADACVDLAKMAAEPLDAQTMTLLEGHSTQAFLVQNGRDGALHPYGHWEGNNWIPTTHDSRIEKLNWQLPLVADHYVFCLLRKGYRWEEPAEGAVSPDL